MYEKIAIDYVNSCAEKISPEELCTRAQKSHVVILKNQSNFSLEILNSLGIVEKCDSLPESLLSKKISVINHNSGEPRKPRFWHSDLTWLPVSPRYTALYIKECPAIGGGMSFANLLFPLKELEDIDKNILTLKVLHQYKNNNNKCSIKNLVTQRGSNGLLCFSPLYFQDILSREGKIYTAKILTYLNRFLFKDENQKMIEFTKGDLVVWDNRKVIHCGSNNYNLVESRKLLRATIFEVGG